MASLAPLAWLAHNRFYYSNALEFYNGPWSAMAIYQRALDGGMSRYPGDHDWGLAIEYYFTAARLVTGWPVIAAGAVDGVPEAVERNVAVRMARQPTLVTEDPPQLWAVLDEAALHRRVGGTGLMRMQLEHLLEMSTLPNVAVQVLPFGAGAHPAMGRPFVILAFPERADPDVVYLEDLTSALYVENVVEVDRYNMFFNHLRATALSFADSARLITSVIKDQ